MSEPKSRSEYASFVRAFYRQASDLDVRQVLMENSACSLRTALDSWTQGNSRNTNYKYVVMLLDHSIETTLKACLAGHGKQLLLTNKANSDLRSTVNLKDCLSRLEEVGVTLPANHVSALFDLRTVRNDIGHFGFLGNKGTLDKLVSFCASAHWAFLIAYMEPYGVRRMLTKEQFDTLTKFELNWHFAAVKAAEIMADWHSRLNVEQDQYFVRDCRECFTLSAILDTYAGNGRCRCCGMDYSVTDFPNR